MIPAFWLTIRVGGKRIPLPLLLIFPLVLVLEILAIVPTAIYASRKKEPLLLKLVSRLYLSRFILVFILRGRGFRVSVRDGHDNIQVAGRRLRKLSVAQ